MADSVATHRLQHLLKAVSGTSVSDATTQKPVKRIVVTGAAGQIGYALLPRIANGEMLGADQPVILQLLEIEPSMKMLNGVVMELKDMAAPLLQDIIATSDPAVAFKDADYAILVGAFPRRAGMERKDLLTKNSSIFSAQGKMLNLHANKNVKVLVVGNPANTMCAVASSHAPTIPKKNFTALTRLDHARAIAQIAEKLAVPMKTIKNVIIWGNHSSTQVPDLSHALLKDFPSKGFTQSVAGVVDDQKWVEETFIPTVQTRGGAIIKARGLSSALSASNAIVRCMRSWVLGTCPGDWVSMAVVSDGTHYDIPKGLVYSMPVQCTDGEWSVVDGLHIADSLRVRMDLSAKELTEERAAISELFGPNA